MWTKVHEPFLKDVYKTALGKTNTYSRLACSILIINPLGLGHHPLSVRYCNSLHIACPWRQAAAFCAFPLLPLWIFLKWDADTVKIIVTQWGHRLYVPLLDGHIVSIFFPHWMGLIYIKWIRNSPVYAWPISGSCCQENNHTWTIGDTYWH